MLLCIFTLLSALVSMPGNFHGERLQSCVHAADEPVHRRSAHPHDLYGICSMSDLRRPHGGGARMKPTLQVVRVLRNGRSCPVLCVSTTCLAATYTLPNVYEARVTYLCICSIRLE